MSNHKLGSIAIQDDIRQSLQGLKGRAAKTEVQRLASFWGVSASQIYAVTKQDRPPRKPRSDRGKRRADLLEHPATHFAAGLVVAHNIPPALALEAAALNGFDVPVSEGTFVRNLAEHGLTRRERLQGRRGYRSFEAEHPGQIYQLDFSALKTRWLDNRTRRILNIPESEVNRNHPNKNPNLVPVWRFALIDDHSRYVFVRYYAVARPNSSYAAAFLLDAFREMGIPEMVYSDNDSVIKGKRLRRIGSILNRAFESSGGFVFEHHLPHNAQASGKVERLHKTFEAYETLIGGKDSTPPFEVLSKFCLNIAGRINHKIHRATGERPERRFNKEIRIKRLPPPATLDAAFRADQFDGVVLTSAFTVSFGGEQYQVPRSAPFKDWTERKVDIVVLPGIDKFILIGLDGTDYEIEKRIAVPDVAGEFKTVPQSRRQRATKALKESVAADKKARKEAGTELTMPLLDTDPVIAKPIQFPQQTEVMDIAHLEQEMGSAVAVLMGGHMYDYWTMLATLIDEGSLSNSQADKAWLKSFFNGREEAEETEVREALQLRVQQQALPPAMRA